MIRIEYNERNIRLQECGGGTIINHRAFMKYALKNKEDAYGKKDGKKE